MMAAFCDLLDCYDTSLLVRARLRVRVRVRAWVRVRGGRRLGEPVGGREQRDHVGEHRRVLQLRGREGSARAQIAEGNGRVRLELLVAVLEQTEQWVDAAWLGLGLGLG